MIERAGAFTLVEMVLVMGLLCLIFGLAAPSLSRSFHQRNLNAEATRLLAVTEYARDEAASQGVPMVVWIEPQSGRFGARAKAGYENGGAREKEFALSAGLHFEQGKGVLHASDQTAAVEFEPDGTLDPSSQPEFRIVDISNNSVDVAQTSNAMGYEIVKEGQP